MCRTLTTCAVLVDLNAFWFLKNFNFIVTEDKKVMW